MVSEEVKKELIGVIRDIQDKCIKNNLLKEKLKEKIISKIQEINNNLDLIVINDSDRIFKRIELWNYYFSLEKNFKQNYIDFNYYILLKDLSNVSLTSLNEIIETFDQSLKELFARLKSQLENIKDK